MSNESVTICHQLNFREKVDDFFFFYFFDAETDTTVPVSSEDLNIEYSEDLEFFFNDKVRKVWHKQQEEWYFSITDVCQALTDRKSVV